jgi:hypothetical protein
VRKQHSVTSRRIAFNLPRIRKGYEYNKQISLSDHLIQGRIPSAETRRQVSVVMMQVKDFLKRNWTQHSDSSYDVGSSLKDDTYVAYVAVPIELVEQFEAMLSGEFNNDETSLLSLCYSFQLL